MKKFILFLLIMNLYFVVTYGENEKEISTTNSSIEEKEVKSDVKLLESEKLESTDKKSEIAEEGSKVVKVQTKVITARKAYFEIGTYDMNDSISKKTRNNYRKFDLKKGDKVIITQRGDNEDGELTIQVCTKGKKENLSIMISPKTMPIYSFKLIK